MPAKRHIVLKACLAVLVAAGAGIMLYVSKPEGSPWLPKCIFKMATGLDCPACGTQRAIHSLMHGEWQAAWGYNAFLFLSLPYVASVMFATFARCKTADKVKRFAMSRTAVNIYLCLVIAWWIARNLYRMT